MIESINFINKEHTLIKVEPEGWIAPINSHTWHMEKIRQWVDGRSDVWDRYNMLYNEYADIMGYDDIITTYEQCLLDNPGGITTCGARPLPPVGYHTDADVNKSIMTYDAWVIAKTTWGDLDIHDTPFSQPAPVILKTPTELPIIDPPPDLVPNTIAPYEKPFSESVSEKKQELEISFDIASHSDVESDGTVFAGGYEAALHMKNSAIFAKGRASQQSIVHSKNNVGYDFTAIQLDKIASDLWESYHVAYVKMHEKLQELQNCPDGDINTLNSINWE